MQINKGKSGQKNLQGPLEHCHSYLWPSGEEQCCHQTSGINATPKIINVKSIMKNV